MFSKTSLKTPIALPKYLVRPWSGWPVLTFGKRPKCLESVGQLFGSNFNTQVFNIQKSGRRPNVQSVSYASVNE